MNKKIFSVLISASMLAAALPVAVTATEAEYSDVYNITFDKGVTSSGSKSPSADTMLAWVSDEGYTRGFGISSTKPDGTSWSLQNDVCPEGDSDKALKVISSSSSNAKDNYMGITTANFNSNFNSADKISCGKDGYTVVSFDFYTDFRTNIRLSAGRFWCDKAQAEGETETESLEEINTATNLMYVETDGDITLQGATVKTLDKDAYANTWHNVKLVFRADNTYSAYLDGEPLIDDTTLNYGEGYSFRGIRDLRLYNINVGGQTSTKYYDNLRYSVVTNAPQTTLVHSENNINRNFALSDGFIFVNPELSVADFTDGLTAKYMSVTADAVLLDSEGTALTTDAKLKNATVLKITNALGLSEKYKVVSDTSSVTDDPSVLTVAENGKISTVSKGKFWWEYSSDYYNKRGYKAELVDAFGGKATGDTSLKLTLETLTDESKSAAFLDIYPQNADDTAYTEYKAPVTFSYSLYLGMDDIEGNSLQGRYNNAVYVTKGFVTNSWNRYAITVYPNSNEYKFYINGKLSGQGELTESIATAEKNRFRFRFQSATVGSYIVIDDIQAVYGVYNPAVDVEVNAVGADVSAKAVTASGNNADFVNTMLVLAEYDNDGNLAKVDLASGAPSSAEAVECSLTNVTDTTKVKAFLWEKTTLNPIKGVSYVD